MWINKTRKILKIAQPAKAKNNFYGFFFKQKWYVKQVYEFMILPISNLKIDNSIINIIFDNKISNLSKAKQTKQIVFTGSHLRAIKGKSKIRGKIVRFFQGASNDIGEALRKSRKIENCLW